MSFEQLHYWLMRTIRRNLPGPIVNYILENRFFGLKLGRDTVNPRQTIEEYQSFLKLKSVSLKGKKILVIGYGGSYGIALELLESGAIQVVLQDPYASVRHKLNRMLEPSKMIKYFDYIEGKWYPKKEYVTVLNKNLEKYIDSLNGSMDLIISSSVLEHVRNVDVLVKSSAQLLKPGGSSIHDVDLRDHFFRYPLEMLCYSDNIWFRYLNASNNLNRLRYWNYQDIFNKYFKKTEISILDSDLLEFRRMRNRIRQKFISGNETHDSAYIIRIYSVVPKKIDALMNS